MEFWNNLKLELDYQGILQKELAAKAGINIGTLRNQMTRNITPDLESAYKLASVLNVSVEYLLTGQTTNNTDPVLSHDETELLNGYRQLPEHDKQIFKSVIKSFLEIDNKCK